MSPESLSIFTAFFPQAAYNQASCSLAKTRICSHANCSNKPTSESHSDFTNKIRGFIWLINLSKFVNFSDRDFFVRNLYKDSCYALILITILTVAFSFVLCYSWFLFSFLLCWLYRMQTLLNKYVCMHWSTWTIHSCATVSTEWRHCHLSCIRSTV